MHAVHEEYQQQLPEWPVSSLLEPFIGLVNWIHADTQSSGGWVDTDFGTVFGECIRQ